MNVCRAHALCLKSNRLDMYDMILKHQLGEIAAVCLRKVLEAGRHALECIDGRHARGCVDGPLATIQ